MFIVYITKKLPIFLHIGIQMAFNDKSGGPWGSGSGSKNGGSGNNNPWGGGSNQNNNPDFD